MILSHKNRFIFIKTRKTAGTSIELALRDSCGPDDVITPISPEEELARGPVAGPRHYVRSDVARPLRKDGLPRPRKDVDFFNHVTAARVRGMTDEKTWNGYFKFAFVRNPWDQTVSHYYYYRHLTRAGMDFHAWLFTVEQIDNLSAISLAGGPALDFVGRYEKLEEDFGEAARRIGLPPPELPRAKAGIRPAGGYRDHYDDQTRARVAAGHARLIEMFGYRF